MKRHENHYKRLQLAAKRGGERNRLPRQRWNGWLVGGHFRLLFRLRIVRLFLFGEISCEVPAFVRLLRNDEENGGDFRASLQSLVSGRRLLGDLLGDFLDEAMCLLLAGSLGRGCYGWG